MSAEVATTVGSRPDIPVAYRVVGRHEDTVDVVTLRVQPVDGPLPRFGPAQFSMIGVVGVGEVPISISSAVDDDSGHGYTIRRTGAVSTALVDRPIGSIVTVRGPFGRAWNLERAVGRHAVFVAGGIGLAPLRAAIISVAQDVRVPRVSVLVGASTHDDQIYRRWLSSLPSDRVEVCRSVDAAGTPVRSEHVGLVTDLIPRVVHDSHAVAYVCGPDPMMTATVDTLHRAGVELDDIEVTLERNMQCGTGWCGHCQLGPHLLCRDGPVFRSTELGDLLERHEL